ncbi:nicotinamide N-methyltransferase-like [Pleurodeles waltl]|uniref:nicotinamide N-methyltransferase-like n=1 Tax=Pleurodeles waltl TaxID=8319 RepID=UPI0037096017
MVKWIMLWYVQEIGRIGVARVVNVEVDVTKEDIVFGVDCQGGRDGLAKARSSPAGIEEKEELDPASIHMDIWTELLLVYGYHGNVVGLMRVVVFLTHQHQQAKETGHSRVGKYLATVPQVKTPPTKRDPVASCECFTDIILSCSTDVCISEVEKWRTNAPGATDWTHAAKTICEIEGNGEECLEKQNKLKRRIKQVLKYDLSKDNPLSPAVLPPADCLLLTHCLEVHATSKEECRRALKNVSSLLKNGGHLILIGCLKETFYMAGSFKFPHLCINERFVSKALE